MSDGPLSPPDPLPATPEAQSPKVRGVVAALAAGAGLTVGLALLAGPRAGASDGVHAAVTPTPTVVATPTPTPSPIPFCDADVDFVDPANAAQDGEVKRLEVTVSGPLHVLGYRVNGTGDPVTLRAIER